MTLEYTFKYDAFQKEAMQHIDQKHSLIVSAPTGAGKTVIAEYVIDQCIEEGVGAIYTAPIKALSNQKYCDFCKRYGSENVGIVTGDVSINPFAPVVIMTTEIFRNALFDEKDRFKEQQWVIFDEIHYIDDLERGTVWEESIMFFPKHMRMLCLSATVPNLDEFVQWIQNVHEYPFHKVIELHRPVPLKTYFQCQSYIGASWGRLKKVYDQTFLHRSSDKDALNTPFPLLQSIAEYKHLPMIYFVFARKRTEELAQLCARIDLLNDEEKNQIQGLFVSLLQKYNIEKESSVQRIAPLIARGIAYHHAGMLPSLKEVVEHLFASRLIKMIFTTETFALGINMPARSVVFDELRKFYGIHFDSLRTRDYYQMAGRAGRRGLDSEGYVYARVNPYRVRFSSVKKIIQGDYEPVMSQFNSSYATLMHLYDKFGEELYDIYVTSFHCFQSNKRERKDARRDLREKVSMLRDFDYIHEEELTVKGQFAAQIHGYELMLGELFANGVLEELDEVSLNVVLSSLVYEPRKRDVCPPLDEEVKALRKMIRKYNRKIVKQEQRRGLNTSTCQGYFHLAPVMEAWSHGENFSELKDIADKDEGEIVRNFRMVIQLLRLLKNSSFVTPQFVDKAKACLDLINRDAIDAERQLRMQ